MDRFLYSMKKRSSSVPRAKGKTAVESPTKMATITGTTRRGQLGPAEPDPTENAGK